MAKETIEEEFDRLVKSNYSIHETLREDLWKELEKRKALAKVNFKDLTPLTEPQGYICLTCGSKDQNHPKTGYCFVCDTDNWSKEKIHALIP